MSRQEEILDGLYEHTLNGEVAPVVGADGYAPDASSTVRLTKELLGLTAVITA